MTRGNRFIYTRGIATRYALPLFIIISITIITMVVNIISARTLVAP